MSERTLVRNRSLMVLTALSLFFAAPVSVLASNDDADVVEEVSITVNGEQAPWDEPGRMMDGRLFLPVAPMATLFGATVEWDPSSETVTIQTANEDRIVMSNGVPVVYFNDQRYLMDVSPFLSEGRTYIPLRYAAGLMSATVEWHEDDTSAELASAESAEGLISSLLAEAEPYAEEDYRLLAKLVQVEAGYESYEGQLAVANVILNRVKDSRFPNTIRDVIYSGKQFPPAHNGLLEKSEPSESVLRAVKDALNGKNNVEGAVYFFNPDVTRGSFWDRLEVVATFDGQSFAK